MCAGIKSDYADMSNVESRPYVIAVCSRVSPFWYAAESYVRSLNGGHTCPCDGGLHKGRRTPRPTTNWIEGGLVAVSWKSCAVQTVPYTDTGERVD